MSRSNATNSAAKPRTAHWLSVMRRGSRPGLRWLVCASLFVQAACALSRSDSSLQRKQQSARPYANWHDPLADLPHGAQQNAALCQRPGDDAVRQLFCSVRTPSLAGLAELQTALGVGTNDITAFSDVSLAGRYVNLAVTAHSSGLSRRSVSALNPRVIAVQLAALEYKMLALAFTRGEQFVEIVVNAATGTNLNFYLVGFRQACNSSPNGCTIADRLTPAIEHDWTEVSLYDETDLKNSVLDCATCHQPDGPNSPKLLRMQELNGPWTHWFSRQNEGGRALLTDYAAAKGDEAYAGMSADQIDQAEPAALSTLVIIPSATQPNLFESMAIEQEVKQSAAAAGGDQPVDNSIPGVSPTWRVAYDNARRGAAIPVPYHDVKVTEPSKLATLTAAYRAYRSGQLSAAELPDLRDVFSDDPERLAELGIGSEPGADGASVLLAACAQCHNPRLDPTLSRARFRADLQGMDRAEKELAISRVMLPTSDALAMPPALLHVLSDEARAAAIDALQE
jgi:mono/diheme cytochrome c family protein